MRFSGVIAVLGHGLIGWRSPGCVQTLVGQVDAAWPNRDRGADGTIAGSDHVHNLPTFDGVTGRATGGTDHMPDALGLVTAVDFDDNLAPGVSVLVVLLALAASRDPRLNYMEAENLPMWPGRKHECSARTGWKFVDVGPSSAGPHGHISFLHKLPLVDDRRPFQITAQPAPAPRPKDDDMPYLVSNQSSVYLVDGPKVTGFPSPADHGPEDAKTFTDRFGAPLPVHDEFLRRLRAP